MTRDFLTAPAAAAAQHSHFQSHFARLARLFAGKFSSSPVPLGAPSLFETLENRRLMSSSFYVATTGSDSAAGTLAAPFRTIQKAATLAKPGDVVNIRGGTYRETITPVRSGTSGAPITFQAYGSEIVTVSAADRVTGFTQYNGLIYKTSVPWTMGDGKDQIFVNGVMMNEARWPNQPLDNVSRVNTSDFDSVTYTTNTTTGVVTATITDAGLTMPSGYWTGATLHSATGHSTVVVSGTVTSYTPGRLTFTFIPNSTSGFPEAGDTYYLSGKLVALDSGGEWYRDSAGTLYARTPDGGDPDNVTLEVKHRVATFDLSEKSYVTVQGIKTFGGTIITDDSTNHVILNKLTALYVSHFTKTDFKKYGGNLTGVSDTGIYLRGSYNTLENSEIGFSAGNGVFTNGSHHTITNNIFHDIDYSGTDCAAINTRFSNTPNTGHVITHNTVYNVGHSGIRITGLKAGVVSYNEVYNYGLQTSDGGGIYTYVSDGGGTVISYNSVHDAFNSLTDYPPAGLYLDEQSSNYTVHHNLTYNVALAMIANGTSTGNKVYNNTLLGVMRGLSTLSNKTFVGVSFANNIIFGTVSTFPGATFTTNLVNSSFVKFVSPATNNYQLAAGSSAINTGTLINGITSSVIGAADIGAYEAGKTAWTAGASRDLVPNTPTNLTVTPATSTSMTVSWKEVSSGQKFFYVERSTDGTLFKPVAKVVGTVTGFTDTGLTASTKYYYRVRADDSGYTTTASAKTNFGADSIIQAEDYSAVGGVVSYSSGVGSLDTGDWIRLNNFDFHNGVNTFTARIGLPNGYTGRKIEIRTGSATGTLLGTLNIAQTGGFQKFTTQSTSIAHGAGVATLYLVFKGGSGAGNMDWYSLT